MVDPTCLAPAETPAIRINPRERGSRAENVCERSQTICSDRHSPVARRVTGWPENPRAVSRPCSGGFLLGRQGSAFRDKRGAACATGPRQVHAFLVGSVDNRFDEACVGFHALYPIVYGQCPFVEDHYANAFGHRLGISRKNTDNSSKPESGLWHGLKSAEHP